MLATLPGRSRDPGKHYAKPFRQSRQLFLRKSQERLDVGFSDLLRPGENLMQKLTIVALAFGASLIGINGAMAAGGKPAGFDGTWSVQLVTNSGICGSH